MMIKKWLRITTFLIISSCLDVIGSKTAFTSEEIKAERKPVQTVLGTWYNELGSEMIIKTLADNTITGTYESKVGSAKGIYSLIGNVDVTSPAIPQAIGFLVLWNNSTGDTQSITSWSGRYDVNDQEISALWLLTSAVGSEWSSTNVGQDVFTRKAPSGEDIQKRLKQGNCSHPMN